MTKATMIMMFTMMDHCGEDDDSDEDDDSI